MNDDLSILIKAILDEQGIKHDIGDIQKLADKYAINFKADINKASIIEALNKVWKQIVPELNSKYKIELPIELDDALLNKSVNQITKEFQKANKIADSLRVNDTITKLNEQLRKNSAYSVDAKKQINLWINELETTTVAESRIKEINSEMKTLHSNMAKAGRIGKSFKETFVSGAKSFAEWTISSGAVMEVVNSIRKMVIEVKNLDDAITDFTMATGANKAQVESLIDVYEDLGDELSATVTDVTVSATEWLKQGKSIAETETLIRDAMVLSKVGKLSSADATKYLTSAMKGYKVSVEDTLSVVDKLSAVDMASATDVGGLAEGMSEVAASADLAGVSMDRLLGYLAAVGEVTQDGMAETGTTFNAIFSRMGNIKLARLKDYQNNGEDLSNVETVLRGVGIELRDSANSFRDFDKVLDETASNWSNYSEVQQRAIASAFAGTHHLNEFIILMENYGKAVEYSNVSMESSGEAMEKFSAYEESITGKTEKFKNAFIQLSNTIIDSDLVKGLVDLGTTGVKAVDGLINALTPLGTIGLIGGGILSKNGIG